MINHIFLTYTYNTKLWKSRFEVYFLNTFWNSTECAPFVHPFVFTPSAFHIENIPKTHRNDFPVRIRNPNRTKPRWEISEKDNGPQQRPKCLDKQRLKRVEIWDGPTIWTEQSEPRRKKESGDRLRNGHVDEMRRYAWKMCPFLRLCTRFSTYINTSGPEHSVRTAAHGCKYLGAIFIVFLILARNYRAAIIILSQLITGVY